MSVLPPILYSDGPALWSRIERALGSGGPVELIIPQAGSFDALKVGDHVLTLPRMVDIAEGSTLVIKLGQQGKLELVKIIPPVPSVESSEQPSSVIRLDQIDSALMPKLFDLLLEELEEQLSNGKLLQSSTQTQGKPPGLLNSPKLNPGASPLEGAIELILNEPEALSKLLTTVTNEILCLNDDEFMARLSGSSWDKKAEFAAFVVDLGRLRNLPFELNDGLEAKTSEFWPAVNVSGSGASFFKELLEEVAVEIGKEWREQASSGNSILEILKAAVAWFKNQPPVPSESPMMHFFSNLNAFIDQHLNVDILNVDTLRALAGKMQILGKSLSNVELLPLNDFANSTLNPKVLRVASLLERFFNQLQEQFELSQQDVVRKKRKTTRAISEITELPPVEIRNRLLDQSRVLERINTSLLLDERILFCLPFSFGGNLESVFGELRKGEIQDKGSSEGFVQSDRPDIRFEVDFRNLGHVLGLIFMRQKRIMLFFENEYALNLCSSQVRLLCSDLGEGWIGEFALKARHLNKNITA